MNDNSNLGRGVSMAAGTIKDPYSPPFFGMGPSGEEIHYKMALTTAAARLREATIAVPAPYSVQLLHTAKLLEAMAGEAEA